MTFHLNASQIVSLFLKGELDAELAHVTPQGARAAAALLKSRQTSKSERVKKPTDDQVTGLQTWTAQHFAAAGSKRGAQAKPFAEGETRRYKIQRHKKTGKGYVIVPLDAIADASVSTVDVSLVGGAFSIKLAG